MESVAYLGPPYSFSHDLVVSEYPHANHVSCPSLHEVVESVAKGRTQRGVVPFYNTTRKSIEESQIELVTHREKVFVTDVKPLDVRHFLCGFGTVEQITELRSKPVVYHQASKWIEENLPIAKQVECPSTSAAVQSVAEERKPHIAAIGTHSASKGYGVPVLSREIQNKPNVTLFFVIQNQKFDPQSMDYVLMCLINATTEDKAKIDAVVSSSGCSISTNWPVTLNQRSTAYFFEVNSQYSTLDLHAAVNKILTETSKAFVCGGYKGKCITRLIWV